MDSVAVSIVKLLLAHPSFAIFVEVATLLLIALMWKFGVSKIGKKLSLIEEKADKHHTESTNRGVQTEATKDAVMELKGLLAGMSNRSGLK